MDFNTGRGSKGPSRGSNDPSRPLFYAGPTDPARPSGPSAGGSGDGFDLSDSVGSFVRTVKALISDPISFFRALPPQGGWVGPLAFAVVCSVLAAVPFGLLFVLLSLFAADATVVLAALFSLFVFLILFPIGAIVSAFVNAAIYHLVLYLLARGNNAGFEATLRVLCYASFPVILAFLFLIPLLNILVGLALSVYIVILLILGMREIHRLTTGQAAIVVLGHVAVGVVLSSLVLGILGLVISALAGSL